ISSEPSGPAPVSCCRLATVSSPTTPYCAGLAQAWSASAVSSLISPVCPPPREACGAGAVVGLIFPSASLVPATWRSEHGCDALGGAALARCGRAAGVGAAAQCGAAGRPRAGALRGQDLLGHRDLLALGGLVRRGGVLGPAEALPRLLGELQAAVVAVAGV